MIVQMRETTGGNECPDLQSHDPEGSARYDEVRAQLAAIVDSSFDAIISKTLDGVITFWNHSAERLFGYTAAEAVGQYIFLIIPPDRRAEEEEVLARLRRGERIEHFETIRQTKDGRRIPISLTISPIRDARGRIIGASKSARDISERLLAEEALRRAHDELEERVRERTAELTRVNESLHAEMAERERVERQQVQLLARLSIAEESERRRIARELHDQLGQQLTALRLTLEMLKVQSMEHADVRVQVETLQELARQLDQDVAFRVWELRPTAIQEEGLEGALRNYVSNWSKHFGIKAQLHTDCANGDRLPSLIETTMYRLAQEALNNVAKHARASHVDIVFERIADQWSLIIEDDGIGFEPSSGEAERRGFGLVGMRERAALVDAELQIESAPGHGTTVILRTPAPPAAARSA
jgi:two-component system sensor histidine kinase UhpB